MGGDVMELMKRNRMIKRSLNLRKLFLKFICKNNDK
jgi:hypothetical protein